jgi:serine/threonine-protein kinase
VTLKAPEVVPTVTPPPVEEPPAPPPVVAEQPEKPAKPKPVATKPKPKPVKEKPEKQPPAETPKPVAAAGGKGTVTLRVLPYAEVFRDGTSLGVTPLKPQELDPGKYEFRFVNPETKKSETKKVTVSSGEQQTLKIDLR